MEPTPSYDLSDYLAMARRHWWIVVLALVTGLGAGAEYNRGLPREYVSSAQVLVRPAGQDANVAGGRTRDEINLDTEAQLMRSTAVVERAAALLRGVAETGRQDGARTSGAAETGPHAGAKTSSGAEPGAQPGGEAGDTGDLAANVSIEVPANTSVLQIKFTAPTPRQAQAGAHAFAQAYLGNREDNARASLTGQVESLRAKLTDLTAELNRINAQLVSARPASSAYATLDSQRDTTVGQINQLTNKINQLTTDTISGGLIIRDARLPGRPIKPNTPINLAAGALLGLFLGTAIAGIRERLDRRVRGRADIISRCGIPVLGEITDKAVPADDVFAPFSAGGRAFNRLRNEVVAALIPSGPAVVVVTGASCGSAATVVAANLAAALARTGTSVVLLGAQPAPLARLLGVAPTPGLSDVLAGGANLGEVTQRAARVPTLRVITAGGTGSAAGLLQSHALRDLVATLRGNADFVVIEAPSTASGADAQSLASLADAAILAVEVRRTLRPEVGDAAEQLRRVDTTLLGVVLLPKLAPVAAMAEHPVAAEELSPGVNGHQPVEPIQEQTILMSTLDARALAALDEAHGR